ncbi:MAG: hypothetical protein KAH14_04400 [Clostridiales bacterium]|nr:hypothetical protein [Clostridiales bacterium]
MCKRFDAYVVFEFYIRIDEKYFKKDIIKLIVETVSIVVISLITFWLWRSSALFVIVLSLTLTFSLLRVIEFFMKKTKVANNRVIFILQQAILLILTIAGALIIDKNGLTPNFDSATILGFTPVMVFKYLLMLLMVTKPVNVVFKNMFPDLKPPEISRKRTGLATQQIGGLIGSMERILIVIFLIVGQFVAIGFVFTAKSITRYKRISIQREFAEYYLLGTLYSMLAAIAVYGIIFKIL